MTELWGHDVVGLLAQAETMLFVLSGAALVVLGGALLLSGRVFDRVSAALVGLSGVYALLWKLPELRGFGAPDNFHIQLTGAVFLFLLSSATLLLASSRFAERARRVAVEKAFLEQELQLEQVYVDILGHDVVNPLTVARSELELHALHHPTSRADMERVISTLDRAASIIEDSVFYSRLAQLPRLEAEAVDVSAIVRDAVAGHEVLAQDRGVRVEVRAPKALVVRSTSLLARVVDNLVSNAIKWSPQGGRVLVELGASGDRLRLTVADRGPGVPPEVLPKLFSRFARADRTGVKGTGLGLAICRRIVELMGGSIVVEETVGGGATFVVDLPAQVVGRGLPSRPQRKAGQTSTAEVPL